ncbi:MAG: RNA pseudouridine synthase, partial [Muribaculaceae bacterium]|nr:RNA pseudouridine synthase [Muribaculaceae bacterium]
MIHRFENGELNEVLESNALPAQFTFPFCYVPHPLCKAAAAHVMRYVESRGEWTAELHAGKMLGVLVVRDAEGQLGFLAAFSGNLAGAVQHSYFVPPVYDLLQPDGEFKRGEAAITAINHEIEQLHNDATLQELRDRLQRACTERDAELERYRALMAESKLRRDEARQLGQISPEAKQQLIAESQFQKAELKRLRRRWETQINALQQQIDDKLQHVVALKQQRKTMSEALQERIFRLFVVQNA